MPQTKKHIRAAYDARTYRQFNIRVRRDSELCGKLEKYISENRSINALILGLLQEHFDDPEPK